MCPVDLTGVVDANGKPLRVGDRVETDSDDGGTTVLLLTSRGGVVLIGGDHQNGGRLFTETWTARQCVRLDMPPAGVDELVELHRLAGIPVQQPEPTDAA